jgi:hypothetical protein
VHKNADLVERDKASYMYFFSFECKEQVKDQTFACICLVDSAPADAASEEAIKAVTGSSPA